MLGHLKTWFELTILALQTKYGWEYKLASLQSLESGESLARKRAMHQAEPTEKTCKINFGFMVEPSTY